MRYRFICIGCTGGCELIPYSFKESTNLLQDLPKCTTESCDWKEVEAGSKECCCCGSKMTFVTTMFECELCKSHT